MRTCMHPGSVYDIVWCVLSLPGNQKMENRRRLKSGMGMCFMLEPVSFSAVYVLICYIIASTVYVNTS